MAARTTLNARNLEALGAPRLAELLLELTAGDAAAKRRLRLALAGAEGPAEVARAVRKRLAEIGRSTAFVDWRRQHALADDLDTQRRAIAEEVARADAPEALDLMWRLLDLADPVLSRCDDSGTVSDVFTEACSNLGEIAGAAGAAPRALADRAFEAACRNDYGQYDELVPCLAPALGREGLEHLRERMIAFSNEPVRQLPDEERRVYAYGLGGPVYADEIAASSRASTVRLALMAIADALGDADAFAAQYDERARKVPRIGAEIAQRLLAAGRAEEAWQALQAAEPRGGLREHEWEEARIEVLEALGRVDEAQAARWSSFERYLSAPDLRAHLKRLPAFDDVEAEERALGHAERSGDLMQALSFLVSWPALDRAAALVVGRADELDGNEYDVLAPAAEALAARHPLAATVALRAMIDFALERARSTRYRHAARHLQECAGLAASAEFAGFPAHDAYVAGLKARHGRKAAFWELVP
jgi:hypothetical protein